MSPKPVWGDVHATPIDVTASPWMRDKMREVALNKPIPPGMRRWICLHEGCGPWNNGWVIDGLYALDVLAYANTHNSTYHSSAHVSHAERPSTHTTHAMDKIVPVVCVTLMVLVAIGATLWAVLG